MKIRNIDGALACIGAVVGAGFASGREIMVFFSRYGKFSWLLILLATGVMCAICALVMRRISRCRSRHWCAMYEGYPNFLKILGEGCIFLLMAVTGGAMISAAGELVSLLLPIRFAYAVGVLFTLLLAYVLGRKSMKPLAAISGVLTAGMLISYFLILATVPPADEMVHLASPLTLSEGLKASVSALAYGGMNMAIALGVVCECAGDRARNRNRTALYFGITMTLLLFVSNYLYLQHEELQSVSLPIVRLLNGLGRTGYYLSVTMLYLAVLTSLTAILCTLQKLSDTYVPSKPWANAATLCIPLLFSLIGFGKIVEAVYAPIGLCCLLLIFLPLLGRRGRRGREGCGS